MKISIEDIKIGDRARKELGELEPLQNSIEKRGLLNPIIITKEEKLLIAGFRRLTCCKNLGLKKIDVKYYEALSPLVRKVLELEENLHKELTWNERAALRDQIHVLLQEDKGAAVPGHESDGQSLADTAKMLNISTATLSQDITLVEAIKVAPQLAEFISKKQALKSLNKIKEMLILTQLAKQDAEGEEALTSITRPYSLFQDDAVTFTKDKLDEESIDLIFFDPPWGIDVDKIASGRGPRGEKTFYDDSEGASRDLIKELLPELYRVMKPNTHMYMFCGYQFVRQWCNILSNQKETMLPDWTMKVDVLEKGRPWKFDVRPIPLVWVKEGGGFTDTDYKFMPRYEVFLFCAKGSRPLNYPISDVFEHIRPLTTERIHPQQKSLDLLKELVKVSTHSEEIVYDPCMGSGASIAAAVLTGRRAVGVERDAESFLKTKSWLEGFKGGEEDV